MNHDGIVQITVFSHSIRKLETNKGALITSNEKIIDSSHDGIAHITVIPMEQKNLNKGPIIITNGI